MYEGDKLQVNAYAYLALNCGFAPIKSLYVIYNDLRPRELKPEPETIPPLVDEVNVFLQSTDTLPEVNDGNACKTCGYYPLCQVLPQGGGILIDHLKIIRQKEADVTLIKELEESLRAFRSNSTNVPFF